MQAKQSDWQFFLTQVIYKQEINHDKDTIHQDGQDPPNLQRMPSGGVLGQCSGHHQHGR